MSATRWAFFAAFSGLLAGQVQADTLDVSQQLWNSLSAKEKAKVSSSLEINLIPLDAFGVIMDAQTLDQSQPGTTTGSYLGAAIGSAAYIDKAVGGGNYSAMKNLGVALLGGVVGSSLDKAPVAIFKTRYTVKLPDGEIRNIEQNSSNGFRHSLGLCVFLNPLSVASQKLCSMTKADLLVQASNGGQSAKTAGDQASNSSGKNLASDSVGAVPCKVGANPITLLSKSICDALGGSAE